MEIYIIRTASSCESFLTIPNLILVISLTIALI